MGTRPLMNMEGTVGAGTEIVTNTMANFTIPTVILGRPEHFLPFFTRAKIQLSETALVFQNYAFVVTSMTLYLVCVVKIPVFLGLAHL